MFRVGVRLVDQQKLSRQVGSPKRALALLLDAESGELTVATVLCGSNMANRADTKQKYDVFTTSS